MYSCARMPMEMGIIKKGVKAFPAVVLLLLAAIALRLGGEVGLQDAVLFASTIVIIRVIASLWHTVMTTGLPLLEAEVVAAARWFD
jgi:hypothetical protein